MVCGRRGDGGGLLQPRRRRHGQRRDLCYCGALSVRMDGKSLERKGETPGHFPLSYSRQADQSNHVLRRVNLTNGLVTTLAGSVTGFPSSSYGHSDGVGTAASFCMPAYVAIDGAGTLAVVVSLMMRQTSSMRRAGARLTFFKLGDLKGIVRGPQALREEWWDVNSPLFAPRFPRRTSLTRFFAAST